MQWANINLLKCNKTDDRHNCNKFQYKFVIQNIFKCYSKYVPQDNILQ